MENLIAKRVRLRLSAVGIKAAEADRRAELPVGYTGDLLAGRKVQPRPKYLSQLAPVLDCDPEYLLLYQRAPRKGSQPEDGLPLVGICEAGVWREIGGSIPEKGSSPYDPDPRFPEECQAVYIVRGDHAEGFGLPSETALVCLHPPGMEMASRPARKGDLVVARVIRDSDMTQSIVVQIDAARDKGISARRADGAILDSGWDVEALILTAIRHLV